MLWLIGLFFEIFVWGFSISGYWLSQSARNKSPHHSLFRMSQDQLLNSVYLHNKKFWMQLSCGYKTQQTSQVSVEASVVAHHDT